MYILLGKMENITLTVINVVTKKRRINYVISTSLLTKCITYFPHLFPVMAVKNIEIGQ